MENIDFIKTEDNYPYGSGHCSHPLYSQNIVVPMSSHPPYFTGVRSETVPPAPAVVVPLTWIVTEHEGRNYPESIIFHHSLLLLSFLQETRREKPNYYSSPTPRMYSQRTL